MQRGLKKKLLKPETRFMHCIFKNLEAELQAIASLKKRSYSSRRTSQSQGTEQANWSHAPCQGSLGSTYQHARCNTLSDPRVLPVVPYCVGRFALFELNTHTHIYIYIYTYTTCSYMCQYEVQHGNTSSFILKHQPGLAVTPKSCW